ncbi:MAG TPA: SIS domain-containing protein [Jatrophihabitans sp.]|nr:SIS domain-containing protein [Jatrophihabitans sp.]
MTFETTGPDGGAADAGGTHVLAEIASQPECWSAALATAKESQAVLPPAGARVAIIGCGTSLHIASAAAAAREAAGQGETDAFPASEMPLRPYDLIIALSRSGTTTEILHALDRVPDSVPTLGITADPSTPIADAVDELVVLDYADEASVVQTRFATSALTLLRAHIGHEMSPVIDQAAQVLGRPVDDALVDRPHYVFLGRGWALGVAAEAALKVREAASAWSEVYPALEYRHGPLSAAGNGTLVWMLGEPDRSLIDDIAVTGAKVESSDRDPQADLVRAQRVAVATAQRRGLDPDQPRHLTRSVVLSAS